jgi:hypothetical protein
MPDRFFNAGFILSPEGEIILRHTKNIISVVEGTTSPYDIWDKWSEDRKASPDEIGNGLHAERSSPRAGVKRSESTREILAEFCRRHLDLGVKAVGNLKKERLFRIGEGLCFEW